MRPAAETAKTFVKPAAVVKPAAETTSAAKPVLKPAAVAKPAADTHSEKATAKFLKALSKSSEPETKKGKSGA